MRLVAFSIYEEPADFTGPSGAVLVDADTGFPLPIEPGRFEHQKDAQDFVRWVGEPCGSILHLRDLARRWAEIRAWLPCPTCPEGSHGRVAPGSAQCSACLEEIEHEHSSNHLREPGRNAVAPAGSRWT